MTPLSSVAVVVLALASVCFAERRACVPTDYESKFGECTATNAAVTGTSTRPMTYALKQDDYCSGPAVLNTTQSVTCECSPDEYEPQFDTCDPTTRTRTLIGYIPKSKCQSNPEVEKNLMPHISWRKFPCACAWEDVGYQYTDCRADGMRSMVSYWKRNCMADPTMPGLKLADPVNIPCSLACADGEYLAPPFEACKKCAAGQYAPSGATLAHPFDSLPDTFVPSCSGVGCKNWAISGDRYLISGADQPNDIVTRLRTQVRIEGANPQLTIEYRMSSSPDDKFTVLVDDRVEFSDSGSDNTDVKVKTMDLAGHDAYCEWTLVGPNNGHLCVEDNAFAPASPATILRKETSRAFSAIACPACDRDWLKANAAQFRSKTNALAVFEMDTAFCRPDIMAHAAQNAGAKAVAFVSRGLGEHVTGQSAGIAIPVMKVTRADSSTSGWDLLQHVASNPGALVTIAYTGRAPYTREVTMQYAKDSNGKAGKDRVEIQRISFSGLKQHATQCLPCAPGSTSKEQSSHCTPCPGNTYSNAETKYQCKNCPTGTMSLPGSEFCVGQIGCTIEDYIPVFSHCMDKTRTVVYVKHWNSGCDAKATGSVPPPPMQRVECEQCMKGEVEKDGTCVRCPQGTYADQVKKECLPCNAGLTSLSILRYPDFNEFAQRQLEMPTGWRRSCSKCGGPGFELSLYEWVDHPVTAVVVGRGLMSESIAKTATDVVLLIGGTVHFEYHVDFPVAQANAIGHINQWIKVTFCVTNKDTKRVHFKQVIDFTRDDKHPATHYLETPTIASGNFTLEWTYEVLKNPPPGVAFVSFAIKSLKVHNERDGGAYSCAPCPRGAVCTGGKLVRCPAGTFSEGGGAPCTPCAKGYVAPDPGSDYCTACPSKKTSDSMNLFCVPESTRFGDFDVTTIGAMLRHPISMQHYKSRGDDTDKVLANQALYIDFLHPDKLHKNCEGIVGFGCRMIDGVPYRLADSVGYNEMPGGIVITLRGGFCDANPATTANTTIVAECQSTNQPIYAKELAACMYEVVVKGPEACRLCTKDDFVAMVASQCGPDNTALETHQMVTRCFGGYQPPADRKVGCTLATIRVEKGVNAATAIVLAVALGLVALAMGVVYLRRSNKRILKKYNELKGEHRGNEMQ